MCNINIYILIGLILMILAMLGLAAFVVITNYKFKKRMEEITMYQINISAVIDESIPEVLNTIIDEAFTDYKIKSLLPIEEGYINSEREDEIRKGLINIVTERISSAALDKLSLFYNPQNIGSVIADKIYITVMNYVLEHNAVSEEQ